VPRWPDYLENCGESVDRPNGTGYERVYQCAGLVFTVR
jgi:hypothetical protein